MKKFISAISIALLLASCGTSRPVTPPARALYTVNLELTATPMPNKYVNLDYGIRLYLRSEVSEGNILKKYDKNPINKPTMLPNPSITSFASESVRRYMRTMGFNLDADVSTDYMLDMTITEFNVNYLSGIGWQGIVQMKIAAFDKSRKMVYPNVIVTGRATSKNESFYGATSAMNAAFASALEDVDWDRIAYFLKRADTPAQEKNKQVTGSGDTALEATVIRWNVESSPRGADVYFRIVSSTPDVKNTNANYIGTTPYESTETFDIKGLTYNNSGNVQVEVSCERNGYITQKKRFNLRQVIDQKEISTKFNLIKEE